MAIREIREKTGLYNRNNNINMQQNPFLTNIIRENIVTNDQCEYN
jgi:hypothetical protein